MTLVPSDLPLRELIGRKTSCSSRHVFNFLQGLRIRFAVGNQVKSVVSSSVEDYCSAGSRMTVGHREGQIGGVADIGHGQVATVIARQIFPHVFPFETSGR